MAMTAGTQLQSQALGGLIDALQLLVHRHAQNTGGTAVETLAVAREAVQRLQWIKRRMLASEMLVAFVGLTNTGKSTLLNALFGEAVVPKWNGPCSSAPVEFRHGPRYRATTTYFGSARRNRVELGSADELRSVIQTNGTEIGTAGTGAVEHIRAELPAPILSTGLVIADTPGFGAAQTGTETGKHQRSLVQFLPRVQQVFWVVRSSGEIALSQNEAAFYRQHLQECCDDLVVTGAEHLEPAQRAEFERYCREQLSVQFLRFHFVSGKLGFAAKLKRDSGLLAASGIPDLEARLMEVADPETRLEWLTEEVFSLALDYGAWHTQSDSSGVPDRRWDAVRVEWHNALHQAGRLESTGLPGTASARVRIEQALKGGESRHG